MNNNVFYKTRICKQFANNHFCPYGYRCQYMHNLTDTVGQKKVFMDKIASILIGNDNLSLEGVLDSLSANSNTTSLFQRLRGEDKGSVRI